MKVMAGLQEKLKKVEGKPGNVVFWQQNGDTKEGTTPTESTKPTTRSGHLDEDLGGEFLARKRFEMQHAVLSEQIDLAKQETETTTRDWQEEQKKTEDLMKELLRLQKEKFVVELGLAVQKERNNWMLSQVSQQSTEVNHTPLVAVSEPLRQPKPPRKISGISRRESRRGSRSSSLARKAGWADSSGLSLGGHSQAMAESAQEGSYYRLVDAIFDELCLLIEQVKSWAEHLADEASKSSPDVSASGMSSRTTVSRARVRIESAYETCQKVVQEIKVIPDKCLEDLSTVIGKIFDLVAIDDGVPGTLEPPGETLEEF